MHYKADHGEVIIHDRVEIGFKYAEDAAPTLFRGGALVRSGSVIYGDVEIGDSFQTGHNVLIRENTRIGDHVLVGTNSIIDGNVEIASFVKIESACYIPTHTSIGSRVFFGPNVVLTNDKYPLKDRGSYAPAGPIIEDGVTLGACVVVLPGVKVGARSFVAAGSIVTRDVPADSLVRGNPAQCFPLPGHLKELNAARSWMPFLEDEA